MDETDTTALALRALDFAPMMLRDLNGRIRVWPAGMRRLYGFDAGEAVGRLSHDLLATEFPRPLHQIESVFLAEGRWSGELTHRRRDGMRLTVASTWMLLPSAADGVGAVMEFNHDVSAEKQAEEARARLASIVETSQDAIIGKTLEGIVTSWNRGAEEMFGYTAEEMVGRSLAVLFPEALLEEEDRILEGLRRGKRIKHYETTRLRKGGEPRRVVLTVSPIRDASGRIIGASKIARDITEQEAVRRRMEDLQSELFHVSRLQEMGQMVSALAHEINQPLAAAGNYVSGVKRLIQVAQIEGAADGCQRAAEQIVRAGDVIRSLREFVRKTEPERSLQDVGKVVQEGCALALIGARNEGLKEVSAQVEPDLPRALMDKIQIQQVMVNLVRNAVEAMSVSPRRELAVTVARGPDGFIEVAVRDTGPGLAEAVKARLFQPFTTTKDDGMGVGLSLTRTIVEAHGGRICAEENPGGGTVFRFTLPAA